ncbi:unnamed protein product, partial [Mesorhabditis belari]|uniref:Thrombospondin type 1 domain protein n=1 Tax=Mesorhabditis belari TaxID=2138241 RepID=A0AAF3J6A5_9BILA
MLTILLSFIVSDINALVIGGGASPNTCQPCLDAQSQWMSWGAWSTCQRNPYGVDSQTRTRQCSGSNCQGAADESRQCQVYREPTPEWNQWGSWSSCSKSCGGGVQVRTRTCNTQCGVCTCQGPATEERACNSQACCSWTQWSEWSACSVSCGNGIQTRNRGCSCADNSCPGSSIDVSDCAARVPCPICNTCYQPPQPIVPPPPVACTTCQQYQPPTCNTCGYRTIRTAIALAKNSTLPITQIKKH